MLWLIKENCKWQVRLHTGDIQRVFGSCNSMELAAFVAWLAEHDHIDVSDM
jgi:hypothetical protein